MTTQLIQITDRDSWLEKRSNYVTSTEASALWGLNPHLTHYEMWHIKRGILPKPADEDNNFMLFGRLMEDTVCQMILHEHNDWKISPMRVFAYDDDDKIGSSFDRVINIPEKGAGLLEIKTTSYKYWKENFIEEDGYIEAVPRYEIQAQVELEVLDRYDWILICVFISDTRTLKYIFRERDKELGNTIRKTVKEFWEATDAPSPDFMHDRSSIAKLMPKLEKGKSMDATENGRITELASMYLAEKQLIKQSEENADKFNAELLMLVKDYNYVWTNNHKITVIDTKNGKQLRVKEK